MRKGFLKGPLKVGAPLDEACSMPRQGGEICPSDILDMRQGSPPVF